MTVLLGALRISRDCSRPLPGRSALSCLSRKELPRAETLSADSVSGVHVSQGQSYSLLYPFLLLPRYVCRYFDPSL
jgi:hypothetical protein